MATDNKNNKVATTDNSSHERGEVMYQVAGQNVKLNYNIVRNYLTKGNGQVSDQDMVQFISICKYNQLNPFLNEAYLVKYGSTPASMIVSKEALMKRAEANPEYSGIKGGIIVQTEKGEIVERTGTFHLKNEKLVGGWAKVYRKDRDFPTEATVAFYEYDKGQSTWKEKPGTMISKVAKVQALREAFPAQLGAMYTAEEQSVPVEDAAYIDVTEKVEQEIKENANREPVSFDNAIRNAEQEQQDPEKNNAPSAKKTGGDTEKKKLDF